MDRIMFVGNDMFKENVGLSHLINFLIVRFEQLWCGTTCSWGSGRFEYTMTLSTHCARHTV